MVRRRRYAGRLETRILMFFFALMIALLLSITAAWAKLPDYLVYIGVAAVVFSVLAVVAEIIRYIIRISWYGAR